MLCRSIPPALLDTLLATDSCAVCFEAFVAGESVRLLPTCMHVFHAGCVDPWLATSATCPLDREVIMNYNL